MSRTENKFRLFVCLFVFKMLNWYSRNHQQKPSFYDSVMGFTERFYAFLVYIIINYYYFIPCRFMIITERTAVMQPGKIVSDEHSFWREKVKLFWIIENSRVIKNTFSKELLSLLFYFQSLILFHREYVAFIKWLPLCYVKPRNSHWIKTVNSLRKSKILNSISNQETVPQVITLF